MIILVFNHSYTLSQKIYDTYVKTFMSEVRECPICHCDIKFVYHDYKNRIVIMQNHQYNMILAQIICPFCHKTQLILLDVMIPYCHYSLIDSIDIISRYLHKDKISHILKDYIYYDENHIRRIIQKYNQSWKNMIDDMQLESIKQKCLKEMHQQFLQVNHINSTYIYTSIQDDWILDEYPSKIEVMKGSEKTHGNTK